MHFHGYIFDFMCAISSLNSLSAPIFFSTIVIRVALVKFNVSICTYTSSLLLPTVKDVPENANSPLRSRASVASCVSST